MGQRPRVERHRERPARAITATDFDSDHRSKGDGTNMDPTLLNNGLSSLRDTIFNVLTQNGSPFAQLGLNIFRTITIVMIVMAGTRIALSGHHSLDKLRTLAGLILIVWIMLTLYTRS